MREALRGTLLSALFFALLIGGAPGMAAGKQLHSKDDELIQPIGPFNPMLLDDEQGAAWFADLIRQSGGQLKDKDFYIDIPVKTTREHHDMVVYGIPPTERGEEEEDGPASVRQEAVGGETGVTVGYYRCNITAHNPHMSQNFFTRAKTVKAKAEGNCNYIPVRISLSPPRSQMRWEMWMALYHRTPPYGTVGYTKHRRMGWWARWSPRSAFVDTGGLCRNGLYINNVIVMFFVPWPYYTSASTPLVAYRGKSAWVESC
ncbi:MAG: hypothetical protein OXG74_21515 [Acidobacteria bacterium]|nr:hypothetical protein [Acidobacteriota bacterium]